ncbi:MAG: family 1 glycosylhydrolase [Aphanocapsa lilacina HA4352-LM1]|jgi:beta-glucosidase/6-phospho-beta-glucosidase/beta-galactosidase|nr:family 1 glycosylhydrolase [Aphanocapsa lilacina HA4352-LM1]
MPESYTDNTEPKGSGDFLWGVASSGYQSEGGFNGPGQPHNNWARGEAKGTVMRTGAAAQFWTRYEADFWLCRGMGLNSFRLGLEWARIQPRFEARPGPAPAFDTAALDAYAERLAACRRAGLEPVVTLHHFTHPAWLGSDAWLAPATVDGFAEYVRVAVGHINRRLIDSYGLAPVHWYITINEPNMLVLNSYFGRQFPAGPHRGTEACLRAYDHLLAAHVRAYNAIHNLYEQAGWPRPRVTLNTFASDLYWSDKVLWDLLCLRERAIPAANLREHLHRQAERFEAALAAAQLPFVRDLPYRTGRLVHWWANRFGYRSFDARHFALLLRTLEASPRARVIDYVAIDYYDPFVAHTLRLPSFSDFEFKTTGLRAWMMSGITSKWWDWRSLPEGLHFFCSHYATEYALPVLIAENGMALRRKPDNSAAGHRPDQLLRSQFLEAHVQQVQRLCAEGVPVAGYLHWSLTDNYEWGSYTPRFGLFAIDFARGSERLIEDHLGDRPSETYARLVRTLTSDI